MPRKKWDSESWNRSIDYESSTDYEDTWWDKVKNGVLGLACGILTANAEAEEEKEEEFKRRGWKK